MPSCITLLNLIFKMKRIWHNLKIASVVASLLWLWLSATLDLKLHADRFLSYDVLEQLCCCPLLLVFMQWYLRITQEQISKMLESIWHLRKKIWFVIRIPPDCTPPLHSAQTWQNVHSSEITGCSQALHPVTHAVSFSCLWQMMLDSDDSRCWFWSVHLWARAPRRCAHAGS